MKLKTLLLLSGGAVAATSANAALNVVERQLVLTDPGQTTLPTDAQSHVYLYNPGTKSFALGANEYSTRASVSTANGYKWRVAIEDADNNLVSLTDSVATQSAWKKMFTNGTSSIWVDNSNGDNANAWQIVPNADGSFRITNTAIVDGELGDALYLGAKNGDDTRLYLYKETEEGACLDWYAVSPKEYHELMDKRGPQIEKFNAAIPLLAILKEADELGVTGLEQFEAVYANEEATVEELNEAVVGVKKLINDYLAAQATAENPVDMSSNNIVNGTFDTIGDFTGWSGSSFGAGGTTSTCAERYNMNYDTWQQIDNLPNGVYALTVQGYYRPGSTEDAYTAFKNGTNQYAQIYAANLKSGEDAKNDTLTAPVKNLFDGIQAEENTVTEGALLYTNTEGENFYLPNNMKQAVDYFNAGYYNNSVMFPVTEGSAKIGVKKSTKVGSTDWSIFDNFKIKYYGNGADAYKLWNADLMKQAKEYGEEDLITVSVLEAYNSVKTNAANGTTYEEVMANIAALKDAEKAIEENKAAWDAYNEQYQLAQTIVTSGGYEGEAAENLAEYCEVTYYDIVGAKALTTEEVKAETAKLVEMVDAAKGSMLPGTEVDYISDPDFSQGGKGWTKKAASGGNVAFDAGAKCAEGWNNSDFDIYQTIEGAPVGAYKISVQGFYRRGRGDDAWKLYFNADGTKRDDVIEAPAYVYCNDMKTPLMHVFEYKVAKDENYYKGNFYTSEDGYCYPNNMADAGLAFDQGKYQIETTGLVAKKGDALRIGMKGNTTQEGDSWAIFTRFKMTYMGYDADVLRTSIEKTIDGVNLEQTMGTEVKAELTAALTAAQEAANGSDGSEMLEKLNDLLQAINKMDESVSLFTSLETSATDFADFLQTVEGYDELRDEANTYVESLDLTNMTNAEANAAIAKIAEYRHQLSLPVGWENATDDAPVDMTGMLASPSFEKDGANSIDGWQNTTGYNFGNNDTQKAALALEFYDKNFDLYQDVEVPNGTYQLTAMAFNRAGNTDADAAAVAAGTPSKALLYAKSGENEVTKPIEHIATVENFGASSEKLGQGAETQFTGTDGNTYYVPNDMVSSVAYFEQGRYYNGVTIKVTDGKLRIGIRQADKVSGSWVIMDDFKLTYFGTDSKKEEGGFTEVDAIEIAPEVAKVEVYSVNGMKLNAMQKGVNILVITGKDGNVTTKTVIK